MKLKMSNIWKIAVLVVIVTTSACGQQRGGQQGGQQGPPALPTDSEIEKMVEGLASEILLSNEQESKVLELYKEHFQTIKSKTKSRRPDRDEMEALKEDFEDEVNAVLTKDQQKLFSAYQKKNSNKGRPQRKN
jgi:hypothetical protein